MYNPNEVIKICKNSPKKIKASNCKWHSCKFFFLTKKTKQKDELRSSKNSKYRNSTLQTTKSVISFERSRGLAHISFNYNVWKQTYIPLVTRIPQGHTNCITVENGFKLDSDKYFSQKEIEQLQRTFKVTNIYHTLKIAKREFQSVGKNTDKLRTNNLLQRASTMDLT